MKLNPNCIRAILITVEEQSGFFRQTHYKIEEPFESLKSYSHEEILYHIRQCEKSGLIEDVHYYDGGSHTDILDLSPNGHAFLSNMRNDSIWKQVLKKGADASLPVLISLAQEIAHKYFLS